MDRVRNRMGCTAKNTPRSPKTAPAHVRAPQCTVAEKDKQFALEMTIEPCRRRGAHFSWGPVASEGLLSGPLVVCLAVQRVDYQLVA